MPVGATIGAAVIGAGAGIYSSSQASKAQSHAANQAADMSLEVANTNNAFAQNMYNQNAARLDPYSSMGLAAGDEYMGLLLGPAPASGGTAGSGWAPVHGATTTPAAGATTTPAPASGYTGPDFATLVSYNHNSTDDNLRENMANYLAYYQAHPELDPGIASLSQIDGLSGDNVQGDEQAARALYSAHQAYLASHPTAATTAPANGYVAPTATAPAVVSPNNALAPVVAQTTSTAAPASTNNAAAAVAPATSPAAANIAAGLTPIGGSQASPAFRTRFMDQGDIGIVPGPGSPVNGSIAMDNPATSGAIAAYSAGPPPASGTPAPASTPTPAAGGTPATNAAADAWDTFRNSTNYQFRLDQGLEGVNTKYAAMGALESGAAMKAIDEYSQNFASNELANYMDALYRQEALGASAASSLAGVGTNLVNQVSANNNNASNAAANAALVQGQGSANTWNAVGSGIGQIAGAVGGAYGSSYSPNNAAAVATNPIYDPVYAQTGYF